VVARIDRGHTAREEPERPAGRHSVPCGWDASAPPRSESAEPFLAGREVVPGLGIEGEFHAGLQAAAAAGRLLGAKGKP